MRCYCCCLDSLDSALVNRANQMSPNPNLDAIANHRRFPFSSSLFRHASHPLRVLAYPTRICASTYPLRSVHLAAAAATMAKLLKRSAPLDDDLYPTDRFVAMDNSGDESVEGSRSRSEEDLGAIGGATRIEDTGASRLQESHDSLVDWDAPEPASSQEGVEEDDGGGEEEEQEQAGTDSDVAEKSEKEEGGKQSTAYSRAFSKIFKSKTAAAESDIVSKFLQGFLFRFLWCFWDENSYKFHGLLLCAWTFGDVLKTFCIHLLEITDGALGTRICGVFEFVAWRWSV